MGFKCGIIGMPNVGKSTLFNAILRTQAAQSENYPFCTIKPNVGCVGVPDERLHKLAASVRSQRCIPAQLQLVDIAGLVKGASKGEGLGNQFLENIRQVDAVVHVLRCFENDNITHVEGNVNPVRDIQIINTELMIADMLWLEKRIACLAKKMRSGDKLFQKEQDVAKRLLAMLESSLPIRDFMPCDEQEKKIVRALPLLTQKQIVYICNVEEENVKIPGALAERVLQQARREGNACIVISAAIESEIAQLETEQERQAFLKDFALQATGLDRLVSVGYKLLNQITFFTVGPKETRAWTVTDGATAFDAAGVIHGDFQRGFICAETISYEDYIASKNEQGAREMGKLRQEGRKYRVADGDIFHFRFNV